MTTAFESSNSGGDRRNGLPGFSHRNVNCASSIYNSTEFVAVDRRFPAAQKLTSDDQSGSSASSSTSSIGKNSDESTGGSGDGEEVQSEYKGGPLDSLDSLKEVLPVKKSISKFYCGKSKSFTSLSDAASCSSIKDITKLENAFTRKRKNLMAFSSFLDKNHTILQSSNGGISKRPTSSKIIFALAAAMNCSETNSAETSSSNSSSPGCCLPPLPPHAKRAAYCELSLLPPADKFSSWRSFSLSDLHGAAGAEASSPIVTRSWTKNSDK